MAIRSTSPRRVALLVETSKHYGRQVLRGIARHRYDGPPWSIFIEERGLDDPEPEWLRRWEGDGIITRNAEKSLSREAGQRGIAVVNLRFDSEDESLVSLYSDEDQIASLAVDHFRERGFQHFAYCGTDTPWSRKREEAFASALREHEFDCAVFDESRQQRTWEEQQSALVEWMNNLPRPVAILACNDPRGIQVLDACRRLDAEVPDEIAVLGVDNDPELCALARPQLSSIDQGVEVIGYEAAELLDQMMAGKQPREKSIHCQAAVVVTRRSTETLAIRDPHLRAALTYIREKANTGISVSDVVATSGVSRRALEVRFRERLQRTIRAQIQVYRIRFLKQLLTDTTITLDEIADRAGYAYTEHMVTMFKREVGETPGQFRRRVAAQSPAALD